LILIFSTAKYFIVHITAPFFDPNFSIFSKNKQSAISNQVLQEQDWEKTGKKILFSILFPDLFPDHLKLMADS
jgi:hypothetical protein